MCCWLLGYVDLKVKPSKMHVDHKVKPSILLLLFWLLLFFVVCCLLFVVVFMFLVVVLLLRCLANNDPPPPKHKKKEKNVFLCFCSVFFTGFWPFLGLLLVVVAVVVIVVVVVCCFSVVFYSVCLPCFLHMVLATERSFSSSCLSSSCYCANLLL